MKTKELMPQWLWQETVALVAEKPLLAVGHDGGDDAHGVTGGDGEEWHFLPSDWPEEAWTSGNYSL